jgi:hypothetical protein
MTREAAATLISFMQTRAYEHDRYNPTGDLPDPAHFQMPTVVLTRDQLVRFRAQMAELHAFACAVTGAGVKDLTLADLMAHLWKTAMTEDPLPPPETPPEVQGCESELRLDHLSNPLTDCTLHARGMDCPKHGRKPRLPWEDPSVGGTGKAAP